MRRVLSQLQARSRHPQVASNLRSLAEPIFFSLSNSRMSSNNTTSPAPGSTAAVSSTAEYLAQHRIPEILDVVVNKLANELRAVSDRAGKAKVVFVLGGPGAGKGTQCANLVRDYGFVHLSAGDLLRDARASGDSTGKMIDEFIKEGKIVPVEVTVNLLKRAMAASGKQKFLIDGFPRNADNLEGWYRVMGDEASVEFVLFFDCPEAVMEERLLKRGMTSGRTDDNAESIRKRFHTYLQSTLPIIDSFAAQGEVRKVAATRSIEEVYKDVRAIFDAHPW